MARKRNPRVMAMEVIAMIRSNAQAMNARWSFVPSTRWVVDENGKFTHVTRARKDIPAVEYRENDPAEWERLADFMEVIERQAASVHAFAKLQAEEARKRLA